MGSGLALETVLRQAPPGAPGAPLPSAVASRVTSHMVGLSFREADGQTGSTAIAWPLSWPLFVPVVQAIRATSYQILCPRRTQLPGLLLRAGLSLNLPTPSLLEHTIRDWAQEAKQI